MDFKTYTRSRSLAYLVAQSKVFKAIDPMPRTRIVKSLALTKLSYKEMSNKIRLVTRKRLHNEFNQEFSLNELHVIFELMDKDNTGSITLEEIFSSLNGQFSFDEIKKTFEILDEDGDGRLSFQEFYLIMNS